MGAARRRDGVSGVSGVSPRWEAPQTVAGFVRGVPNAVLLDFARGLLDTARAPRCLDLGCGAARNALPLARLGYRVVGTDLSAPMLAAARERLAAEPTPPAVALVHAPMAPLPFADGQFDLIVAHGIWNLAGRDWDFRAALAEAARVARPGAGLFVFTFSRATLPPDAAPDAGERFVFSTWNGEPQCFLTEAELLDELARAGFGPADDAPLTEYNRPLPGELRRSGPPVIWEGRFVRRDSPAPRG